MAIKRPFSQDIEHPADMPIASANCLSPDSRYPESLFQKTIAYSGLLT